MKFNNTILTIIQAYAPTEKADDEEINKFYRSLEEAHTMAGKNVVVIGDFNAKIGQPKKNENLVLGKFGYGTRNKRGELLIQYAFEHKLSIMNTYFKKKNSRRWTWLSPDHNTRNEIDFIMTNQPKNISNVEVLMVEFPSDHRLVRTTFHLGKAKKGRTMFKSATNKPDSEEDITTYHNNLKQHLQDLRPEDQHDVQTYYDKLESIIKNSIQTKIHKNHGKTNCILSKSTQVLITRRSELIKTKHKSKEMKKELSKLFKITNKAIKEDYKTHRNKTIERNLTCYRSTKRAFKELTTHKNWIQSLKTESRNKTNTRRDIIGSATTFYKKLYEESTQNLQDTEELENKDNLQPITEKEVIEHIKTLKTDKSPGPDGLQNEALKMGAAYLAKPLAYLFNMVLNTCRAPKQWKKSDIILLYKKGDPQDVANYRPISLLSSVYKLFTSILQNRMKSNIDHLQPVEQAGFRSGFSTMDHIHVIEQIIEKYKEYNKPLYVAFIDYAKAFDTISHDSIWRALKQCKTNEKYIQVLRNIYKDSISRVKLETRGAEIPICRGVRQGDPLSPKLFIAVLQSIFAKLDWDHEGIRVAGHNLNHLRFADDIVLFAETSKKLEEMIDLLSVESEKVGLKMNEGKTKIMTNSKENSIYLKCSPLEYVHSYIYLGKQISFHDRNTEEEVERRIAISWKKFWSLKEILKGDLSLQLKKTVLDTCILPTLTYGCQTWSLTTRIKSQITTCQRAMERSILKISKIQKIRSEVIRKKTKLTDALQYTLKLKWKWAGHLARYTERRWTIEATRWTGPSGKRRPGRPRKRWTDDIIETAGKKWMLIAKDRDKWSKLEEAYTQRGVPY